MKKMVTIKSILHAFRTHCCDDVFLRYDDGNEFSKTISISYNHVHKLSQEIISKIQTSKVTDIVGLYFNPNSASILGIVPSIIAVLELNCAFIVLDRQAQPLHWIQETILKLGIRYILTDEDVGISEDLYINEPSEKTVTFETIKLNTSEAIEKPFVNLLKVQTHCESNHKLVNGIENIDNLLYVVQTSGTTSQSTMSNQKLIFVTEKCILPNIKDFNKEFQLSEFDNILAASPPTFDPFYVDVFLALYCKSSIIFVPQHCKTQGSKLLSVIKKHHVNFMQITPTLFRILGTDFELMLQSQSNNLKTLLIGGEPFPIINSQVLSSTKTSIYNVYGVSEMSCWQTCLKVNRKSSFNLDIVAQIGTSSILSETEISVSQNFPTKSNQEEFNKYGEIIVSSRTRQCHQMINGDFIPQSSVYQVRTGDVGYVKDGNVFIIGREELKCSNTQNKYFRSNEHFKINGKKITLPIIQRALEKTSKRKCLCLLINNDSSNKDIITFVVETPGLVANERYRKKQKLIELWMHDLPSHYIPRQVILIDNIPLTRNGKLDLKALHDLAQMDKSLKRHIEHPSFTPEAIRTLLGEIWQKLLPAHLSIASSTVPKKIPLSSQFVSDGGDSILALRLIDEMENILGVVDCKIPIELILNKTYGDIIDWLHLAAKKHCKEKISNKEMGVNYVSSKKSKNNNSTNIKMRNTVTNYWNGISVATKGLTYNYETKPSFSIPHMRHSYLNYEPKADSKCMISELWNVDLHKCVDASPVVVILDHPELRNCDGYEIDPAVKDVIDTVFIGSHSGLFVAVNLKTGNLKWQQKLGGRVEASCSMLPPNAEKIFVGSYDFHMYALSSKDGSILWKYKTDEIIKCTPCVTTNFLIFGSYDRSLHCISTDNGTPFWTYQYSSGSIFATPLLYPPDNSLLSVALDGSVVKLDISSNNNDTISDLEYPKQCPTIVWKQNAKDPIFSTPILNAINSTCIIAFIINVRGRVFVYDYLKEGNILWTYDAKANIFSSPILLPHKDNHRCMDIVFGAQNKTLYKLSIIDQDQDGKLELTTCSVKCELQWEIMLDEAISSTPTAFWRYTQCSCFPCNNHHINKFDSDSLKRNNTLDISSNNKLQDGSEGSHSSLILASVTKDGMLNITCGRSGAKLDSFYVGHNIFSSPVIVNDNIIIGNRDNYLTCLQLKTNS